MMRSWMTAAACAALSVSAWSATVTVFPSTTWVDIGGTSAITADAPRNGNGSLRVEGPRSRFATGNVFPVAATPSLGLLSALSALSVDVRTDANGAAPANSLPVVRLHIFDPVGAFRSELIWENAETGPLGTPVPGTWYAQDIFNAASVWRFVNTNAVEIGRTAPVGSPSGTLSQSLSAWASNASPVAGPSGTAGTQAPYSSQAFIGGISIGIGGGATGFLGFADNLRIAFAGGPDTTFNFEVARVPEPGSLALAGLALMGIVAAGRRRA